MADTAAGSDDLETIEGIGPAIAALLRAHRIRTFAELATQRPAELRRILRTDRDLARAEPSTWALQARLLAEGRHGDFVRLIAMLKCGVPRLCNIEGLEECCAVRLRAGGICTVAELQRSTVARVVECFPQNDRAQVTRWAPRWIEHAHLLHEGDEAALCALARIDRSSGQVRGETRRNATRTASDGEMAAAADTGLVAYWQRESRLRLLCAPLGGLALLLLLLLIALLGLIPSPDGRDHGISVRGGGTTISMIQAGGAAYPPYPQPYPPYPQPYPPYPQPYAPYPQPYPPYAPYPWSYPPVPGSCCPTCAQPNCPPTPTPTPPPTPAPTPQSCTCEVCGCEADGEAAGM